MKNSMLYGRNASVDLSSILSVKLTVFLQLMSHGERTPSERELAMLGAPPPEHVFAPYGAGALTNVSTTCMPLQTIYILALDSNH